jgi:hypothetical protein
MAWGLLISNFLLLWFRFFFLLGFRISASSGPMYARTITLAAWYKAIFHKAESVALRLSRPWHRGGRDGSFIAFPHAGL